MSKDAGQTYIDRTQCSRDRLMKVLCLGPGRTGTDSMRVALKILGFDDCYHGYSCVHENPPDNELWQKALDWKIEGKGSFTKEDWDRLLGHCQAVSDLPCVLFSEELINTYPSAKVILTHPPKGVDRWYQSCCKTIVALRNDWTRDAWGLVNTEAAVTRNTFFRAFDAFWRNDFRQNAYTVIEEHAANIRRIVPSEQLLEYDVTQGWEPLARFLEVPVPHEAFPSGNDPQDFFRRFQIADRRRRINSLQTLATYFTLAGVIVGLGMKFWPSCQRLLGVGSVRAPW